MNRGHLVGISVGAILIFLGYAIFQVSVLVPSIAAPFLVLAALMAAGGVVLMFYGFTFVGNLTFRRRVFNENIAMVVFVGKGGYARWAEANLDKPQFEIGGKTYNILHNNLLIRKGMPIAVILADHENSVNVMDMEAMNKVDPWVVTSFIKTIDSLNKAEAFNKIYNNLFLLNLVSIGLLLLLFLFLFLTLNDIKGGIGTLQGMIGALKATATPVAGGAIPHA